LYIVVTPQELPVLYIVLSTQWQGVRGTLQCNDERGTMKNWAIAATAAAALTVTALGMPGAATAAPSGPSSVDDTVASLQAEGYTVIVTRLSGVDSPNCSVSAVRPGQQITQETPTGGRGNHARQIVSNTVYVDLRC
jgi:hypothetical protein